MYVPLELGLVGDLGLGRVEGTVFLREGDGGGKGWSGWEEGR